MQRFRSRIGQVFLVLALILLTAPVYASSSFTTRMQAWHKQYPVVVRLLNQLRSCRQVRGLSSSASAEARGMDNLMLRLRHARLNRNSRKILKGLFLRQRQRLVSVKNRLSRIHCHVPGNRAASFRMMQVLRNLTAIYANMIRIASDAIRSLR